MKIPNLLVNFKSAPREFVEGIISVIRKPPEAIADAWEELPLEKQELLKQAGLAALELTAKIVITANKHYKV